MTRALPPKRGGGTSSYAGVSWDRDRRKWRAVLNVAGETVLDQRFESEIDAAKARDAATRDWYEPAKRRVNFAGPGERGIHD